MTDITALARERGEWDIPRSRVAFISTMRDDEVAVNMTRVPDVDAVDSLSLSAAELTARGQIDQVVSLLRKYYSQATLWIFIIRTGRGAPISNPRELTEFLTDV